MSPLTPDERALMYECSDLLGERLAGPLRELADKLEAEPDDHDLCTITGDVWAAEAESRERAERERGEAWAELAAARGEADMWHKIAESRLDERDEARSALSEAQRENAVNLERALKAENQRDEARAELADVRTHLEDARLAVEGVMGGSVPPDWSVADLAEDVARIALGEYRGRVETREALRDLAQLLREREGEEMHLDRGPYLVAGVIEASLLRAEAVLEGVERTHTLVPNEQLERAAKWAEAYAGLARPVPGKGVWCAKALNFATTLRAAARGEFVTWPTEERAS